VCSAIDPNMTFVVPLAAAIVECRGGILIHGAIIAHEYGIPCVTGIPLATSRISSDDKVTVDGYLGIVTLDKNFSHILDSFIVHPVDLDSFLQHRYVSFFSPPAFYQTFLPAYPTGSFSKRNPCAYA